MIARLSTEPKNQAARRLSTGSPSGWRWKFEALTIRANRRAVGERDGTGVLIDANRAHYRSGPNGRFLDDGASPPGAAVKMRAPPYN
jgi:hypothetical protein